MAAIRTSARANVDAIREVIAWPRHPQHRWVKGFLAGIFDAEGGYGGVIRIANTDPEIIDWTTYCLRRLDFPHVVEHDTRNGVAYVRLTGRPRRRMRFLPYGGPRDYPQAFDRGLAIKSDAPLGWSSLSRSETTALYDITTGTGDFIANGVVSHNCFARPTHTYLDLDAGRDFEREIVVKVNAPELLRAELSRPSWKREHVALGTNTDPYQWVESRYKLMPGIWEALLDSDTPCSLVTKSPLALRDVDILSELARGPGCRSTSRSHARREGLA